MGITRLGNITGLDRIGIPVAIAVRPNSRSVSVSQGKGLDLAQATASALMEAIEGFHAEEVSPARRTSYRELGGETCAVVEPLALCTTGRPFDPDATIAWVKGFDVLQQEPCWVPAEIVHTDYTQPLDGYFLAGSNGLASGNHIIEAITAGICELVERDAVALWSASGMRERARRRLDIASVDDPDCRALIGKYAEAGMAVGLWDVTTDIGLAAFICDIHDLSGGDPRQLRRFHGAGCHPDRAIALVRALTEAAQARLTYIAGMRDDLLPAEYEEPTTAEMVDALLDALCAENKPHSFRHVPSFAADDLGEDLRWELERLRVAGIHRVIAVDLTRPDFGIPVVRVAIPGLEGDIRITRRVCGRDGPLRNADERRNLRRPIATSGLPAVRCGARLATAGQTGRRVRSRAVPARHYRHHRWVFRGDADGLAQGNIVGDGPRHPCLWKRQYRRSACCRTPYFRHGWARSHLRRLPRRGSLRR
jgi:YcaO-like protein with predicted kinase domain